MPVSPAPLHLTTGLFSLYSAPIFRCYIEEVSSQKNLELANEIFDCYLAHQPDGSVLERSPEDVKRLLSVFHAAFPDFHSTIEDQIAGGTRWSPDTGGVAPTAASLGALRPRMRSRFSKSTPLPPKCLSSYPRTDLAKKCPAYRWSDVGRSGVASAIIGEDAPTDSESLFVLVPSVP